MSDSDSAGTIVGQKSHPWLILTGCYSAMVLIFIKGSISKSDETWGLGLANLSPNIWGGHHVIPNFNWSTQCFSSFKNSVLFLPGVRTTVLWAALVCSVTKSVSVRMEPSVIISTVPVCVKLALKALIAKRDSVPRVSMASSVTNTAPVTAPTPWGEWDLHSTTHLGYFFKTKEFIFIPLLIFHVMTDHVTQSAFNCDRCFIQNFSQACIVHAVVMQKLGPNHAAH